MAESILFRDVSDNPKEVSTANPFPVVANDGGSTINCDGVAYTLKRAFVNVAASQTDSNIVSAVASRKITVISMLCIAGAAATNVTFNSKPAGAGGAISSLKACAANGGFQRNFNPYGYLQTVVSEGLTVTTGAGSTVGIDISYIEIP